MERVFLSPPDISELEIESVVAAMRDGWIAPLGPDVNGFEQEFAQYVGAPAAAALSSGTAALHLALIIAGVQRGDLVFVPSLTFVATANAAAYVQADVEFIDAETSTWGMNPDLLEQAIASATEAGKRVGAVIPVDLYGQCCELDRIRAICDRDNIPMIEDAAEALGGSWKSRSAGCWGDVGAFSFNGNKIITTSGGGMLVGSESDMDRARYLGSQARQPVPHYQHDEVGYNYRLSNLLAALGRVQLSSLPQKIERLHDINGIYRNQLADIESLSFMPWDERGVSNGWLTVAQLDPATARSTPSAVIEALEAENIEARPVWKPMHLQPMFSTHSMHGGATSERLFSNGFCLPSGSSMTESEQARVIESVRKELVG